MSYTSNFGMFLLVPPSKASTGRNANIGPFMSTKKFYTQEDKQVLYNNVYYVLQYSHHKFVSPIFLTTDVASTSSTKSAKKIVAERVRN